MLRHRPVFQQFRQLRQRLCQRIFHVHRNLACLQSSSADRVSSGDAANQSTIAAFSYRRRRPSTISIRTDREKSPDSLTRDPVRVSPKGHQLLPGTDTVSVYLTGFSRATASGTSVVE